MCSARRGANCSGWGSWWRSSRRKRRGRSTASCSTSIADSSGEEIRKGTERQRDKGTKGETKFLLLCPFVPLSLCPFPPFCSPTTNCCIGLSRGGGRGCG